MLLKLTSPSCNQGMWGRTRKRVEWNLWPSARTKQSTIVRLGHCTLLDDFLVQCCQCKGNQMIFNDTSEMHIEGMRNERVKSLPHFALALQQNSSTWPSYNFLNFLKFCLGKHFQIYQSLAMKSMEDLYIQFSHKIESLLPTFSMMTISSCKIFCSPDQTTRFVSWQKHFIGEPQSGLVYHVTQ